MKNKKENSLHRITYLELEEMILSKKSQIVSIEKHSIIYHVEGEDESPFTLERIKDLKKQIKELRAKQKTL